MIREVIYVFYVFDMDIKSSNWYVYQIQLAYLNTI